MFGGSNPPSGTTGFGANTKPGKIIIRTKSQA